MPFDAQAVRDRNLQLLKNLRLPVTQTLPLGDAPTLRPVEDIARRLLALDTIFAWVARDQVPEAELRARAEELGLVDWMSIEERAIFETARSEASEYIDSIGWRLENMWPLAWVLGFEPAPPASGEMVDEQVIREVIAFCPAVVDGEFTLRTVDEIAALEDLFYCAHNAARNISFSGSEPPDGWDPVASGGVIHERRHTLTWCLTPDDEWDDISLDT